MAIYDSTVSELGKNIRAGLDNIASAIEKNAKRPTYNVIVNVAAGQDIGDAVVETLQRIEKREAAVGG